MYTRTKKNPYKNNIEYGQWNSTLKKHFVKVYIFIYIFIHSQYDYI